jgi:hypothetical protein
LGLPSFNKDPSAVLDYYIDWTDWLAASETILTATWTVPAGITKDSQTLSSPLVGIWLSGGTAGTNYLISCKVVTNQVRTDERSMMIIVRDR